MPRPYHGPKLSDKPNRQGFWEIRWNENGRTRSLSTRQTNRTAAQLFLAGWLQENTDQETERAAPLPVAALFDLYNAEHAAEHVNDLGRIKYAEKPLRAFFGAMKMHEIDDGTFAAYARKRRDDGIKPGTTRRELEHLRAVLRYAVRNRKRTHVLADDLPTFTMPEKAEPRSRVASQVELDRLMDAAQKQWIPHTPRWRDAKRLTRLYRFIAIARWGAARSEAVRGLVWSRVDLDAGMIDFREPGRRLTQKRRVPVPIDPKLMPILRRAFAERTTLYVLDHPGSLKKQFQRAAARAGCPDITPHTLRHSWATHQAERGVSFFTIATFLGDTMATVEKNYAHRSPDHLRKALFALDESQRNQA